MADGGRAAVRRSNRLAVALHLQGAYSRAVRSQSSTVRLANPCDDSHHHYCPACTVPRRIKRIPHPVLWRGWNARGLFKSFTAILAFPRRLFVLSPSASRLLVSVLRRQQGAVPDHARGDSRGGPGWPCCGHWPPQRWTYCYHPGTCS